MEKARNSSARDRILETAMKLFYANGVRATGIDTIIKESGVAKMTFYNHFPSKQNLVIAVLNQGEQIWLNRFQEFMAQLKTPRQKILGIFDFVHKWSQEKDFRGCAYINATVESASRQTEECLLARDHKKKLSQFIELQAKEMGLSEKLGKDLGLKLLLLFDGAIVRAMMDPASQPGKLAKSIAELVIDAAK